MAPKTSLHPKWPLGKSAGNGCYKHQLLNQIEPGQISEPWHTAVIQTLRLGVVTVQLALLQCCLDTGVSPGQKHSQYESWTSFVLVGGRECLTARLCSKSANCLWGQQTGPGAAYYQKHIQCRPLPSSFYSCHLLYVFSSLSLHINILWFPGASGL